MLPWEVDDHDADGISLLEFARALPGKTLKLVSRDKEEGTSKRIRIVKMSCISIPLIFIFHRLQVNGRVTVGLVTQPQGSILTESKLQPCHHKTSWTPWNLYRATTTRACMTFITTHLCVNVCPLSLHFAVTVGIPFDLLMYISMNLKAWKLQGGSMRGILLAPVTASKAY